MNERLIPGGYLPRLADDEVRSVMESSAAVVIEGPKSCGKTWTGLRHSRSAVMLDRDPDARLSAAVNPAPLLDGSYPRLLDEWQTASELWNVVRGACDDGTGPGRFILTGSAVPADDTTRHSGAGRIRRVRMRPMSLFESGESTGEVSLGTLLDGGACTAGPTRCGFQGLGRVSMQGRMASSPQVPPCAGPSRTPGLSRRDLPYRYISRRHNASQSGGR